MAHDKRGVRALVAVLWLLLMHVTRQYTARLLPDAVRASLTLDSYLALTAVLTMVLGAALTAALLGDSRRRLALAPPSPRAVALSLAAAPAAFALAYATGLLVALPTLLDEIRRGGVQAANQNLGEFGRVLRESPLPVTLIWVAVIAPLGEELAFRGAVYGAIEALVPRAPVQQDAHADEDRLPMHEGPLGGALRWARQHAPSLAAVLLSTLVFGAMHLGTPGGLGILLVASATLLGLLLGAARALSQSLAPPLALHACYNVLGLANARGWLVTESMPRVYGIPSLALALGAASLLLTAALAAMTRPRANVA